jgi:tight adherence protein B
MSATLHFRPARFAQTRAANNASPGSSNGIPTGSGLSGSPGSPANGAATRSGTSALLDLPVWLRYPTTLMVALLTGILLGLANHSPLPAALVPTLVVAWVNRSRKSALHRQATAQRAAVVALCAALRAELDGGALPHGALLEAVWCRPELRDLADQINAPDRAFLPQRPRPSNSALFNTPVDAPGLVTITPGRVAMPGNFSSSTADLIAAAALAVPGRSGLSGLAACWRATEEHGLPLAGAVAGIEDALRAEEQRQLVLDAELSGIRTTMGLLAVLPVFGLLLGSSLGIRPWQILLQTFGGQVCLVLGCALELIGLWWADRLVASVTDLALPRRRWQARLRERWPRHTCCSAPAGVGY